MKQSTIQTIDEEQKCFARVKKDNSGYNLVEATLLETLAPDKEVVPIDKKPDHCECFQTNRRLIVSVEPVIRVSR